MEMCMTQQEVAERARISRPFYTQIENNFNNKNVSVKTAKSLATVMNFHWTRLFDEEEERTQSRDIFGDIVYVRGPESTVQR